METKTINPWRWQEQFGFSQAVEVRGGERTLYCGGQASVDGEGRPLHDGDMAAQLGQALDNLERVLSEAGLDLTDVVRLDYYTTDLDAFFAGFAGVAERLGPHKPASTLLGVDRLAFPELLVEIEATAVG